MERFYFTYGTHGQPYIGGWTVVEAENIGIATAAYRAYHQDIVPGFLNCGGVYTEDQFMKTTMSQNGNYGFRCREVITIGRSIT